MGMLIKDFFSFISKRGGLLLLEEEGQKSLLPTRIREEGRRMLQEGNLEQQAALMWAAALIEKENNG